LLCLILIVFVQFNEKKTRTTIKGKLEAVLNVRRLKGSERNRSYNVSYCKLESSIIGIVSARFEQWP